MIPLTITDVVARFQTRTPLYLGPFAGMPIYGALKRRARYVGCAAGEGGCPGAHCEAPTRCPVARLFEPAAAAGLGHAVAASLVLRLVEPQRTDWRAGDALTFRVRLIGRLGFDQGALTTLSDALGSLPSTGLGVRGRPTGRLDQADLGVERYELHTPTPRTHLSIRLASPLRLRKLRDPACQLELHHLAFAAAHRLRALATPDIARRLPRPRDVAESARSVRATRHGLRRVHLRRRARNRSHPAQGVIGALSANGLPDHVAQIIIAAAPLHLGALVSNGFGQIDVEPTRLPVESEAASP